jgi:hypothetical protein
MVTRILKDPLIARLFCRKLHSSCFEGVRVFVTLINKSNDRLSYSVEYAKTVNHEIFNDDNGIHDCAFIIRKIISNCGIPWTDSNGSLVLRLDFFHILNAGDIWSSDDLDIGNANAATAANPITSTFILNDIGFWPIQIDCLTSYSKDNTKIDKFAKALMKHLEKAYSANSFTGHPPC